MNNEALFYKKEDIVKNKIKASNKMFKMAREKRLRSLFNQEKEGAIRQYGLINSEKEKVN